MSGSRTITTEEDRLPNVHPGDILRHDFLIGGKIALSEVAERAGIEARRLQRLLDREISVDADIDLRLARYFGMSEGFFLGLQADHDVEEFKRSHAADLDRIIPRAA